MKEYTVRVDDSGSKFWHLDGLLHREDGPAVNYADGAKSWYLHGELHRESGPAIEWADGTKMWYLHDELHREDGPAIEYADGRRFWYLHGNHLTEEEHKRRISTITITPLAAGDSVILKEQADRIKALERQRGELLQALEILTERIGSDEWFAHWSKIAKRAIAKAKGE